MLTIVNQILTRVADVVMSPWSFESPWPGLLFVSSITACLLVGLFALTSNQTSLRRSRNRLLARVLELLLFRHDAGVSLSACGRILKANGLYLATLAAPVFVSVIPIVYLFALSSAWFDYRPLKPGEVAVVEVELAPQYPVLKTPVLIRTSDSVKLDSQGIRIPARNELCFAVHALSAEQGWIEIQIGNHTQRQPLATGNRLQRVESVRHRSEGWQQLVNPASIPLPPGSPVKRLAIQYPVREWLLGDSDLHWTVIAFVLIMASGLVLGKLLGVGLA